MVETKYAVPSSFTGLAVDYFNHRLYWADPELSHIGSMRTDGSDPLVTISEKHGKVQRNINDELTPAAPRLNNGYIPVCRLDFQESPNLIELIFLKTTSMELESNMRSSKFTSMENSQWNSSIWEW